MLVYAGQEKQEKASFFYDGLYILFIQRHLQNTGHAVVGKQCDHF